MTNNAPCSNFATRCCKYSIRLAPRQHIVFTVFGSHHHLKAGVTRGNSDEYGGGVH